VPRTFSAQSGLDGAYRLFVPAQDVNVCGAVTWTVTSPGYQDWVLELTMKLLSSNPLRDFSLEALATPTPPDGLTLTGLVRDARAGRDQFIARTYVAVSVCLPRTFSTHTWSDGRYSLFVPGEYLSSCTQVTLRASAPGYWDLLQVLDLADLRANLVRDLALEPQGTATPVERRLYLPVVLRQ
jgi:hypothetical protein